MDHEIGTEIADASWPELSADLTLARTQARSIMLDTQRANSDGRILELAAQLELMRTRMTSLEQHLFETQSGVAQDLIERLGNIDSALHATEVRFNGFSNRISAAEEMASTTMLSTTTAIDARIEAGEVARRAQASEIEELSTFLEQSFSRIAELSDLLDSERSLSTTDRQDHDSRAAAITSKMSTVEQSISDLGLRLDEAANNIASASLAAVAELEESVAQQSSRLDDEVTRVDEWADRIDEEATRIDQIAAKVDGTTQRVAGADARIMALDGQIQQQSGTQDEIASAIHFLQSRAEAIESSTSTHASDMVERLNDANQRLDEGFANVAALRADFESAEPEVNAEMMQGLEARVVANNDEQAAIIRTLDQVAESFKNRILQQDGVLEAHSTILNSTEQVLADQRSITAANASAIAEFDERDTAHGIAIAGTMRAIEEVDSRAHDANRRADETDGQIGELHEKASAHESNIESLSDRLGEAEPVLHTHSEQIDALNDWSTALDGRILDIQSRSAADDTAVREQIEAVDEQTTVLGDRTESLEDRSNGFEARLDELGRQSIAAVPADTPPDPGKLDALTDRVDELSPTVDAHDEKIDAINDWVTVVDGRILDIMREGETTDQQIEAVNDWVTVVDGRILDINTRRAQVQDQLEAVDNRTSQLEERFGTAESRIEELDRDRANFDGATNGVSSHELTQLTTQLDASVPRIDTQDRQIEAINDWVTVIDGRITEIRQEGSDADQKFEAVNDWVTVVDGRILELQRDGETAQRQIEAVNDWSTTLDGRILKIQGRGETSQRQIEAVNDWVTVIDGRILDINNQGEQVQDQIEAVNDWATNLEIRTFEMDSRLSQAQHALVEMTNKLAIVFDREQPDAGLRSQVEELTAATADLQARAANPASPVDADALAGQVAAAERSVLEMQNTVQNWIRNLEQTSATANEELRDFMVYRIDTAEDRIDRRLVDIEASGAGNERLEAIERAVTEADDRARDAYAFSENLRLLQTDLVQAIRGEMATQAEQIERHDHAIQNSGAPIQAAGSPDLGNINARVDEVTRGMAQLHELQQRHGSIESKLTEALTSTHTGLGQTQHEVASLRSELEAALRRIDQLEGRPIAEQQRP